MEFGERYEAKYRVIASFICPLAELTWVQLKNNLWPFLVFILDRNLEQLRMQRGNFCVESTWLEIEITFTKVHSLNFFSQPWSLNFPHLLFDKKWNNSILLLRSSDHFLGS